MSTHLLAGKPAPREMLVNVPRLVAAYYSLHPNVAVSTERVAFGTSGHRGTSLAKSFNEDHVLAICQAICEYKLAQGYSGPLYLGMDTHALSEPAFITAIEVLAANGINLVIQQGFGYTPTPVISHAILTYNRGRATGLLPRTAPPRRSPWIRGFAPSSAASRTALNRCSASTI